MPERRFFVLAETCSASEIPAMLGRVVRDKVRPLDKYAPIEPLPHSKEPRHNAQDIIPGMLPVPSLSTNRQDFLSSIVDSGIRASVSALFGMHFGANTQEQLTINSEEVKRYTLNNPGELFKELMKNDLYARDVEALLRTTLRGRAYFVTGFMTTRGTEWSKSQSKSRSMGADITIPISAAGGMPIPGLGDPQISPSRDTTREQSHHMVVADEEIFAVAYSVIKTRHSLDSSDGLKMKKSIVVGPPKRAKSQHQAFGADDDESEDEVVWDETAALHEDASTPLSFDVKVESPHGVT